MSKVIERFLADRAALPLPKTVRTRSGIEFSPGEAHWRFRDGAEAISINFELLPDACTPLLLGLKKTLIWYFEMRAPSTAERNFSDFLWLSRRLAESAEDFIERIRPEDIVAVKLSSDRAAYRLSALRGFLVKWSELGAPGVEPDAAYVLERLSLPNSPVGEAVATLDPKKGPLTDLEFNAIQTALNNAYARDEIDTESLLLCYLLMSTGSRPVQFASLKCCDLIVPEMPDGDYLLRVPRAKQKELLARSEFKWRRLTQQIGKALAVHVEAVQNEFAGRLQDTREAPLFPQRKHTNVAGFAYHQSSSGIAHKVAYIFAKLHVFSERLNEPIRVNPLRLRRTFATRAAEEGWPLLVIAEMMDHSDTRSVEVYAGLTSRIRAQFSRKIAMEMAPLAMVFAGKIIRSEEEATRHGAASRIIDLRVDRSGVAMGSCGSYAHCGFARPIACYAGCYEFEPWLDGPHEAALDYMFARRDQLMTTTDSRIATINDRAILGCAQVILRCRQILAEESHA